METLREKILGQQALNRHIAAKEGKVLTKKVFARIGFEDLVLPIETANNPDYDLITSDCYLVGYEDKYGVECNEDGSDLDSEICPKCDVELNSTNFAICPNCLVSLND